MNPLYDQENRKAYKHFLETEEKSPLTIEKYLRDIRKLQMFTSSDCKLSKQLIIEFKEELKKNYKISSINSILAAVNHYLKWSGYPQFTVKSLKSQRHLFYSEDRQLSVYEYRQLIKAAKSSGNYKMALIMQTICTTGIRVSELEMITVESLHLGTAMIDCKNKTRTILLPQSLRKLLKIYTLKQGIKTGSVFVSANKMPLHRSYIWNQMKNICSRAQISPDKVFPHNLRHLFARTYYQKQKDITGLADILGHSSIETTRIYTITSASEHILRIENLGLVIH